VIFCNGFEAVAMLKQKTADIFTTFACVSEPNPELNTNLTDTLVWDTGTPYFYMRTTDDGRLLLGGEDTSGNKTIDLNRKDRKATKLIERFHQLSPGANFVEDFTWAGKFGSTKDGLPYIGATKQFPNSYFVLGFGGNGITFSVQGMELILKLLKGEDDIRLECYQFDR
jgi:glycine/D-amino acid oxidase-like deaminating enzyme